jgi:hypothetical protein
MLHNARVHSARAEFDGFSRRQAHERLRTKALPLPRQLLARQQKGELKPVKTCAEAPLPEKNLTQLKLFGR